MKAFRTFLLHSRGEKDPGDGAFRRHRQAFLSDQLAIWGQQGLGNFPGTDLFALGSCRAPLKEQGREVNR